MAMTMVMTHGHACCLLPLCPALSTSITNTMQNPSSSSSSSSSSRLSLHPSSHNRHWSVLVVASAVQHPSTNPFSYIIGHSFLPPAFAAQSLSQSSSVQVMESSGDSAVGTTVEAATTEAGAAVVANENLAINILGVAAFLGVVVLTVSVVYLAVTDFLERRARDEETKKLIEESKNTKKKKVSTAGTRGPKGFGKKLEDSD